MSCLYWKCGKYLTLQNHAQPEGGLSSLMFANPVIGTAYCRTIKIMVDFIIVGHK